MFQLQLFVCSIVTNGTACVVALPRHKFVTGATLLQLAVTVKIPSHTIVVYIELVHKDPL
jgi:hypothetical protein